MRWPIRNQILLPLIAVQLAVVFIVSATATWWSLVRVEQELQHRLNELTHTIREASFPLTASVLEQMRGLSGAEFVMFSRDGRVMSSTLKSEDLSALTTGVKESGESTPHLSLRGQVYLARAVRMNRDGEAAQVLILYPDSLLESARRDAWQGPVLLGSLTLLVTIIAVALVAQRIGKRIQGIERHVARVAGGDFRPIPLAARRDELRELSSSVNQMSQDLERMTSQIRLAERAWMIKQLAGGIAHQLRNALTGARMAVQLHRRAVMSPTTIVQLLHQWAQRQLDQRSHETATFNLFERFLNEFERPVLKAAIESANGNRKAAADLLGLHRETLRKRLRKIGLTDTDAEQSE